MHSLTVFVISKLSHNVEQMKFNSKFEMQYYLTLSSLEL